jgi:hypothetical protein
VSGISHVAHATHDLEPLAAQLLNGLVHIAAPPVQQQVQAGYTLVTYLASLLVEVSLHRTWSRS